MSILNIINLKLFCMCNVIFGAFFFMVPLSFVLALILPDFINVVLVPLGLIFGVIVFVADCVRKKVFTNAQLFKMFLNSLLSMKLFTLYDMTTCTYVATGFSLVFALALLVVMSNKYDELVAESLRNNRTDES